MFRPVRNFGKYGVIQDTVGEALPIGAWTDARNVRFSGLELEKMLDPALDVAFSPDNALVQQGWSDSISTYVAVATQTAIYFLRSDDADTQEWVLAGSGYDADGEWQAFAWGDTCIFNNGIDPPQIFNNGTLQFEDLPKWGLVSTASDISNSSDPSKDTKAACKVILPYKGFLVALGVTENGLYQPNTAWWSNSTTLAGLATSIVGGGPPDWDYESPASLSGKTEIGIGDGPIRWGARLNENLIVYTDSSATALSFVGGTFVMSTRRLFNKGCAGLNLAIEFNNQHFVVSQEQIYIHDGSTVRLIAKDRVEEEFFKRAGKGGRYGNGNINFDTMQLAKDPDRKEIWLGFDNEDLPNTLPVLGVPDVTGTITADLLYAEELETLTTRFPDGKFWVEGQKIMINAGGDRLVYSPDLGKTWQDLGDTPTPGTSQVSRIQYRPDTGQGEAWFIEREDTGAREAYRYYTTNFGQTWVAVNDGGYDGFSSATFIIDSFGRAVFAGSGQFDKYLARINNPLLSNSIDESLEFSGRPNTDNLREVEGGYVLSVWDGSDRRMLFAPYDLSSFTDYGWEEPRDDDAVLSENYTDPDGQNWVFLARTNAVGVPYEGWNPDIGSSPFELDLTWDEATDRYRINGNDRYLVAVSVPSSGDDDRWLIKLSDAVDADEFTDTISLQMPSSVDNNQRFHIQHAVDDYWVGYYTESGYMRVVLIHFGPPVPSRTALVWNFEDDNYTWADLAAVEGVNLSDASFMHYRFDDGWVTRWNSSNLDGISWADISTGTSPWREPLAPRWLDFSFSGRAQNMYWLTADNIYQADVEIGTSDKKLVFVERQQIDLDDLDPSWTSNYVKHLRQVVFLLQTPITVESPNTFDISAGWAQNLMDQPDWVTAGTVELNTSANGGKYKWDVRTSGRYLSLRMDFDATNVIRMTGADIDVEPRYGR